MQYTTQELVQNFLSRDLTDKESNILSTLVFAIERQIDKELGTTFKNTSSLYAAVRYFDGGKRHVQIDPCQNITNISVVDTDLSITTEITTDTYVAEPINGTVKRMITMRFGRLPRGYKNIKITADFTEYGAEEVGVPSDIQTIATRIVGNMVSNPEAGLGLRSEKIEGHEVVYGDSVGDPFKTDPVVKNLIDARRIPLVDDGPNNNLSDEAEDTLGIY